MDRIAVDYIPEQVSPARWHVRVNDHFIGIVREKSVADLIAAAPDLLAALTDLVWCIREGEFTPEVDAARAAIARATGGGRE